jgi:hypothetical protein
VIDASDLQSVAPQIAAIDTVLYSLEDRLQDISDRLAASVTASLSVIEEKISGPLGNVLDAADVNLPGDGEAGPLNWSAAERLMSAVDAELRSPESTLAAATDRATESVNVAIQALLPSTGDIFSAIVGIFSKLIDGLLGDLATTDALWQGLVTIMRDTLTEERPGLGNWLAELINDVGLFAADHVKGQIDAASAVAGAASKPFAPSDGTVEGYIDSLHRQPAVITATVNSLAIVKGVLDILGAKITGYVSGVQQASLYDALTTPLTPPELVHLLQTEKVGENFAKEHAKRSGLSNELFDLKMAGNERLLDPPAIIELWRRYGSDTPLAELKRMGYSDVSIERLKLLALANPTPSDVVRFLARDVYDPSAIAAGGLDQDFDQKYDERAFNASGVSRETARLYWMAHWSLPSPTQGYQMVHRGLITIPQLEELLKLADYAPGWVQNLIDIAYQVPGRIDVRRMFQSGVIPDHAGLVVAYQRMGYSPDDSETLAVFTERLSAQQSKADHDRRNGPIAAEVMRAFVVGIMSEVQARQALAALGYDAEYIDLAVAQGGYRRQSDRADKIRKGVGQGYIRGYATREETIAQLQGYAFDDEEIQYLLNEWDIDRALAEESEAKRHAKDLTRGELLEAYRDRLITSDDAVSNLVALGYDESESRTIMAIESAKETRADSSAITASVRAQYLAGKMSAVDAHNTLEGAGLQPTRIAALLSRWEVEAEQHRPTVSASQLERMLMQGIVDQGTLETELRNRRYSEHDINMLLTLWGTDVAVAQQQIDEKVREFNIREERLSQQGAQRIGLQSRGLDIRESQFAQSQSAVQQRFDTSTRQRADLQQQRLDTSSALQTQRLAAETARSASAQEAAHQRELDQIQAQADRLDKQISAASDRQTKALAAAALAQERRAALQQQAQDVANARQAASLSAQADRQAKTIAAAQARADQAAQQREALAIRHEDAQSTLATLRSQLTQVRDIRLNAERINTEARTEQVRIRTETRAAARKGILASTAAANASELQSSQLQQASAIADVNARYAALQAEIAAQRQQAALTARQAAEAALAAATPAASFLDLAGL